MAEPAAATPPNRPQHQLDDDRPLSTTFQPQPVAVGRIVHVVYSGQKEHAPGIIIGVSDHGIEDTIHVTVFPLEGIPMVRLVHVPYDRTGTRPGSWHWPPRK